MNILYISDIFIAACIVIHVKLSPRSLLIPVLKICTSRCVNTSISLLLLVRCSVQCLSILACVDQGAKHAILIL